MADIMSYFVFLMLDVISLYCYKITFLMFECSNVALETLYIHI